MGKGYQVGDKKKYGKGKTKRKAGPGRGKKVTNTEVIHQLAR